MSGGIIENALKNVICQNDFLNWYLNHFILSKYYSNAFNSLICSKIPPIDQHIMLHSNNK